ncbi:UNVERIFIED_CONTAM: hypothetical protein Sindi_0583400, partial [Sesamum indicum]
GRVVEDDGQNEEVGRAACCSGSDYAQQEAVWRNDDEGHHVVNHDEDSKTWDDGKHHRCSLGNYMSGSCPGEH